MAALALGAAAAGAQGSVRGQLGIVERPGERRDDLASAVVWLEPVGRDAPAGDATPLQASILMKGREFLPHVQVVRTGGSVAFPNDDPFSHNVFSNTALGAFDLGLYRHGASRAAHFDRAGVYPIYCNIHHRMVSFVVAVPGAWTARPDGTGRWAVPNVPAGRWVLHVWHERAGELARPLDVPAQGIDDLRLALDARAYAPAPHLNKFGLPYTATRADRY